MDAFHYVYQPLNGDGSIVAHVTGLGNTNVWAKAGVMIRETLNADSKFADVVVTPGSGTAFQRRTTTGGSASSTTGPAGTAPIWVKIERVGNVFTGSVSSDGATWTVIGTETIPMASTVYIGLAVTSHDASITTMATADSVSGTGGWSGGSGSGGGAGAAGTSGGGHRGGGCGATGLELLLLLGVVVLFRRER
jgi:regulation of enolase protein 1 (concanavalin A-like superfamily)